VLQIDWNYWAHKKAILTSSFWLVRSAVFQKLMLRLILFSIFTTGIRSQKCTLNNVADIIKFRGQNNMPNNTASIQCIENLKIRRTETS